MTQLTGLSQKVFMDRYSLKDAEGKPLEGTPEEMWKRVARGISDVEPKKVKTFWRKKFYNVMKDFKFLPGGRIFAGAGTGYDVTYYNCFVIPSPKDSRDGILDNLKSMIEIMARGGGVGLNLSSLRPRGARVKKVNGFSSGPINWAELYSLATKDIVQQGGSRRGALMLMLHDWHPDFEEFITVKQDLTRINGANLSVCLSDAFMEAVKKDADWDLCYPDLDDPQYDKIWEGDMTAWKQAGGKIKVYKTVKASYLWNLICTAAWQSAEPGLHFLERSNKRGNTWYFEKLIATNPCVTGDTLVGTPNGWRRADEIKVGDKVGTILGSGTIDEIEIHEDKPVFKITTSDGAEIRVTAAHQFHAIKHAGRVKNSANKHFSKLVLAELTPGDMLRVAPVPMPEEGVPNMPAGWGERDYGFFIGMLLGDGCITEKSLNRNVVKVAVNTDEVEWTNQIRTILEKTGSKTVSLDQGEGYSANLTMQGAGGVALMVKNSLLTPAYSYEKTIPLEYQNTNKRFLAGLLDGLFSTDGNVNLATNHPQLRFKTTSKQLAQDIRRILLSFGIHGRISTIKKVSPGHIGDRIITSKHQQYEIHVSGYGMKVFVDQIGLSHPDKNKKLQLAQTEFALTGNTWLTKIVSILPDGIEKVYDLHEPVSDTWITEGLVSRGCGEQPLSAWAVCNLGAMNLVAYVKPARHASQGDAGGNGKFEFDYDSFGEDVQTSTRFLDDVIDSTYYFMSENEKCAKEIRRTGLGIMGLGDALIMMKLRYGAEDSLPTIEKIFKTLRDNAYTASIDIAREKGAFPKFEADKYLKGHHIKALPAKIRERIAKYGIRNAVLLTIAPTGTTSLLAGVTSGIEPVYEFEFTRKSRLGVDKLYHPLYDQWRRDHPEEKRPDYFVSANDLTPMDHAKVQALAQGYIDSSISKTVNAPNNHTVQDVKDLYMSAYDMGMKGITYMRDGSRLGVLQREDQASGEVEKKDDKKEDLPAGEAGEVKKVIPIMRRPMVMRGLTYKTQTPLGDAFITINNDENDQPFEMFLTIGKSGSDIAAMTDALGRIISLVLRLQSPVESRERVRQIIAQLSGIGGTRSVGFGENRVRSVPDALAKVLAEEFKFKVNGRVVDVARHTEAADEGSTNGLALNGNGHTNGNGHVFDVGSQPVHADTAPIAAIAEAAIEALLPKPQTVEQLPLEVADTNNHADVCPECGVASFVHEEGCVKCYSCGHSEC